MLAWVCIVKCACMHESTSQPDEGVYGDAKWITLQLQEQLMFACAVCRPSLFVSAAFSSSAAA